MGIIVPRDAVWYTGMHIISVNKRTMSKLQESFSRIQEAKRRKKEIDASLKDALRNDPDYIDVQYKLERLRERKKEIMEAFRRRHEADITRIDRYKRIIAQEQDRLSDLAFTRLVRGEDVVVTDQNDMPYDPVFTVRFRKGG